MPRGVYERKKKEVQVVEQPRMTETVVQNVPRGTTRIRQYSTNKDHMGEGEPLCLNCGHRSDMHYTEHRWVEKRVGRNLQGDFLEVEEQKRKKVYDSERPCQHACKCTAYE